MNIVVPAPGQLVEVRKRQFVVQGVSASTLPTDVLSPGILPTGSHLVMLSAIDDEGLGEEQTVLWELEPGARVIGQASLPEPSTSKGFDHPARLEAFLDAVRWGATASADVQCIHAPFRSGISIEDYQLDPVARALSMPRVNLLIADDVGLGKTVEAGLVVEELLLRHRASSVLVVCPSGLQIQWREQMRDKFGLEFRIIDGEAMKELRRERGLSVNPWTHFPRLITSVDFLKRERPLRLFREALPEGGQQVFPRRFDLLILDEAHNVAPKGKKEYAIDSLRTQAIRSIAPHFEHKLFLSATPHNGYRESFAALLELLDPQRFHRSIPPDPRQLAAVMVRRMKDEIRNWDGSDRFARREVVDLEVHYSDEEKKAHHALHLYARSRVSGAGSEAERIASEFVLKTLKKRLFSSPAAFASSLERHEKSLATAGTAPRRAPPPDGVLRRMVEGIDEEESEIDEDTSDEAPTGPRGNLLHEVIESTSRLFRPLSPQEQGWLALLRSYAARATHGHDSKADRLIQFLRDTVKKGPGWTDQRVILFTEYRATQNYLRDILARHGLLEPRRVENLHGGMDNEDREKVKAAFQAAPGQSEVRVLLATDAASEGIDLQNHCHLLVHYEIPWNPNRLEQRNGRIDRHGQRQPKVLIHHFVPEGWRHDAAGAASLEKPGDLAGELEFLLRTALKVDAMREDLGKVGPVITSQLEEVMLGKRSRIDTGRAETDARVARAALKVERNLRELLKKLWDRLQESRETLHLTPKNVLAVVREGLALAGQPALIPCAIPGLSTLDAPVAFHLPPLAGSWARASEGLAHPFSGEIRPVVFDHEHAKGRDDVVLAHLNHRLVHLCLGLLRAEVWAHEQRPGSLARITSRLLPRGQHDTPILVAHARLLILGTDSSKLHEELLIAGGKIVSGRLEKLGPEALQKALDASRPTPAPAAALPRIVALWPSLREPLQSALDARRKDRVASLGKKLAERAALDHEAIDTILTELEQALQRELTAPESPQLGLFDREEKEQHQRDREALRHRLEAIPAERARESQAITDRYKDPTPRLFPIALTCLWPEGLG